MKKTILILLLFISVFCLCGCIFNDEFRPEDSPYEEESGFFGKFFEVYQDSDYMYIVYDKSTKVVYYIYDGAYCNTMTPYYLPDGTIAVYGKNFPYKGGK